MDAGVSCRNPPGIYAGVVAGVVASVVLRAEVDPCDFGRQTTLHAEEVHADACLQDCVQILACDFMHAITCEKAFCKIDSWRL